MSEEPLILTAALPVPGKLVSLNDNLQHHALRAHKAVWFQGGFVAASMLRTAARQARVITPFPQKVSIQLHAQVATNRRRDGHNFAITAKWFIDGLVTGRLLEDDSTEHVVLLDWTFESTTAKHKHLVVTVREAP
jgi:hypothetical protein